MIESLSLLGIKHFKPEMLKLLATNFTLYVDMSPSIIGIDLKTDIIDLKVTENVKNEMLSANVKLNAIQGVFFGIERIDPNIIARVQTRINSICDALDILNSKIIYLGAPSLRSGELWKKIVASTLMVANSRNKTVILENICEGPCSGIISEHYLGFNTVYPDKLCVDISNYVGCFPIRSDFKRLFLETNFVHLSGPNHTLPSLADSDFWKKQELARQFSKTITYEFLDYEIEEIIAFLPQVFC